MLRDVLPQAPSDAARRRTALGHLAKSLRRAGRFAAALDTPAAPPAGLTLRLVAGDEQATDAVAAWDGPDRRLVVLAQRQGDGRVLRSATGLPAQYGVGRPAWAEAAFLPGDHMSIMHRPMFAATLGHFLGGTPGPPLRLRDGGRGELLVSAGLARPFQQDDLLLPEDPEGSGVFEAAFLRPMRTHLFVGLGLAYAFVSAAPPAELAHRLGPEAASLQPEGGALHFLRTTFTLE